MVVVSVQSVPIIDNGFKEYNFCSPYVYTQILETNF